nr:MAG: capsid protein [Crogonang virus 172]
MGFSIPQGFTIPLGSYPIEAADDTAKITPMVGGTIAPGIATIHCLSTLGTCTSAESAANVASRMEYIFVRHANSGHANYEAPDLFITERAVAEVYSMIGWATTTYALMQRYSPDNRYTPRALVKARGFDYDNLASNMPRFNMIINMAIAKAGTLRVPKKFNYLARLFEAYTTLYADSSATNKTQYYQFIPDGFWQYSGTSTGGTTLVYKALSSYGTVQSDKSVLLTLDNLEKLFGEFLDALMAEEDVGIMCGDILKAYGDEGCWHLGYVPMDLTVSDVHDENVLLSIRNIVTTGDVVGSVVQSGGYLTESISRTVALTDVANCSTLPWLTPLVDLPIASPSADDVINATRYMFNAKFSNTDSEVTMTLTSYDIIIVTKISIASTTSSGSSVYNSDTYYTQGNEYAVAPARLANVYAFNYMPSFTHIQFLQTGETAWRVSNSYRMGEFDNVAALSMANIAALNDACLLSEYGVPNK